MTENNKHLENLSEIRTLMEKSSRFISLSGLSGVAAGLFALSGIVAAYLYLPTVMKSGEYYKAAFTDNGEINFQFFSFFIVDASIVLLGSIVFGIYFTVRKSQKKQQAIWDNTSKRLLINLSIPLVTGAIFCFVLLYHGLIGLIAPATLIFYGLALINSSKYTLNDIRYLGIIEVILGLISSFFIGAGLLFWAIGFGVLHIIYGIVMYNKYEK
ncbi:MAG: hypothetical protein V4667_05780 [Bacteroidota bacterium]